MEEVEIIGEKIWCDGYAVAELSPDAPASVLDRFRAWVEMSAQDIPPSRVEDFREYLDGY